MLNLIRTPLVQNFHVVQQWKNHEIICVSHASHCKSHTPCHGIRTRLHAMTYSIKKIANDLTNKHVNSSCLHFHFRKTVCEHVVIASSVDSHPSHHPRIAGYSNYPSLSGQVGAKWDLSFNRRHCFRKIVRDLNLRLLWARRRSPLNTGREECCESAEYRSPDQPSTCAIKLQMSHHLQNLARIFWAFQPSTQVHLVSHYSASFDIFVRLNWSGVEAIQLHHI